MSALTQSDTWKKYVEYNCLPKQHFDFNEIEDPLDVEDEELKIESEHKNRSESQIIKEASSLANGITVTLDLFSAGIESAISGEEREKHRLSDYEKSELTNAWALVLAEKNVQLSPTALLVVTMACIFVPKYMNAFKIRKERKLQKLQDNKVLELETEIKTLNKKLKDARAGESSKV